MAVVLCLAALVCSGGCASGMWHLCGPRPAVGPGPWDNPNLISPERLDQGYVVILPGAWGNAPKDHGLAVGLTEANVPAAIEVYDWTAGAFLIAYNLRALDHNREEAQRISKKIVAYQERYPGRPVHLIGYSGGGGVAALALEALPPERKITGAVLLAATLAPDYDLQQALSHSEHGIYNFYSPYDVVLLGAAVAAVGTTEGRHTYAAGAAGFHPPANLPPEQAEDYRNQISQHAYKLDMVLDGHPGGHFGWTSPAFVTRHVAPLLLQAGKPEEPASTPWRREPFDGGVVPSGT